MAPFRNRDRSNRSGRGQIEHNVLEGLPINQYREVEITIGPNAVDNKPVDKDAWPELPMPRDSHMLPEHSQQLLRAARSGRVIKPPAPPEDDNEMKDEEEEHKEVQTGFTVKKYTKVARHLEAPEPEYLAKRRKGLPSPYVNGQLAQPALRETKVQKLDAEGNVAVYKVLVPEGQAVEGEVKPTDAAIEVAPVAAAPGTIVEGVGVVNAEGVVVANDILQQTPPRRRPPPPKKKVKRAGPGRGKKKVVFAEGATEQGTPASTTGSDVLTAPSVKQEDGSVAPSDGGDTPMADAGAEEEEGSGDEGSEDEDHDMDHASTPTTPSKLPTVAPTSVPEMDLSSIMDVEPSDAIPAPELPIAASVETSQPLEKDNSAALPMTAPETTQQPAERDPSSSPDLPLSSISHSRQNSLNQTLIPGTATEALAPDAVMSEVAEAVIEPETATEPVLIAGLEVIDAPIETSVEASIEAPIEPSLEAPIMAPIEASNDVPIKAPLDALVDAPVDAPVEPPIETPNEAPIEAAVESYIGAPNEAPIKPSVEAPIETPPIAASAPPSEPDLLGSLERQLEKDSEDMAGP
ncbi:hypothetical protein BKA66DRAFT_448748 [Pyrenochaeta sp. MPI-SDFR-AT-0127]|nr:hypothetical protein BKA66DRAFT_448748 [Pyrenochaeta sp. MPI-SDFR-AT-0127]